MQDRIPPLRYLFRSTHGTGGHCDRNPAEAMHGRPCGRKIERVRVAAHSTHPLVRLTRLVLDRARWQPSKVGNCDGLFGPRMSGRQWVDGRCRDAHRHLPSVPTTERVSPTTASVHDTLSKGGGVPSDLTAKSMSGACRSSVPPGDPVPR